MKKMMNVALFMSIYLACSCLSMTYADPTIINNNNGTQNSSPCNNGPLPTDSRVPPAGVYTTKNNDGSSQTDYTTGETKPYIVDNSCNNNTTPVQPYVFVPPNNPTR